MTDDPLIGKTIGNIHIERQVGRGGMAQVYYGRDIKLRRPVAVKVIDPRYRGKTAQARRFLKEARLMAQCKHENIVQVYSADDEGDLYFYVMEYVDGRDLSSIISSYAADGELMPIADVLRIGRAIANALDYAHAQQVIHRDVKPSNVLVARDGRVMLSDFGLALDMSDGSEGDAFGTAYYISPEQARRSSDAVPQSDLYSLGVILYEMLTGAVPFSDPSPASVALQHITEPPPLPRSRNPEISGEAELVLLKALEKDPRKRFQSGAELMDALEKALARPKPAAITPLPPLPIGVPTIQRRTVSQNSVADRISGRPPKQVSSTVRPAGTVRREPLKSLPKSSPAKERGRRAGLSAFGLIVLAILVAIWLFKDSIFHRLPGELVSSATPISSANVPHFTQTATKVPLTSTPGTSQAAATLLPNQAAASLAASPTKNIGSTATINPLNVNLFLLLYNDNSFFITNRSRVTRSISGFTFERLNDQGKAIGTFYGWEWERYYSKLAPKRCMAIYIASSPPYLEPVECGKTYISILTYERTDASLFWTAQENSHQFKVLWENAEVGRCDIGADTCEVYVP